MILAIALLAVSQAAPQEPPNPSPSKLLTESVEHYASAKTLSGTIHWVQSALGAKVTTDTTIQIERPSKLYLRQDQNGSQPRTWITTSDGTYWTYDRPDNMTFLDPRLIEKVNHLSGPLGMPEFYVALEKSMGDRGPILDFVFGHPKYLKATFARWATLLYRGKVKVRNIDVVAISGDLRAVAGVKPTGNFELYLTDKGDIVRYIEKLRVAAPSPGGRPQRPKDATEIDVTSVWDADLKVDGKVDGNLFHLIR